MYTHFDGTIQETVNLFDDDFFVKAVVFCDLFNDDRTIDTKLIIDYNKNYIPPNTTVTCSLQENTNGAFDENKYKEKYDEYMKIANNNNKDNDKFLKKCVIPHEHYLKFIKLLDLYEFDTKKATKHEYAIFFNDSNNDISSFMIDDFSKIKKRLFEIADCVEKNLKFNLLFYGGVNKIDQHIDYGNVNVNNDTVSYNISDGSMCGIGYDNKRKMHYVTSCIYIEFNHKKETYHVYPVLSRPQLDDKYKINFE